LSVTETTSPCRALSGWAASVPPLVSVTFPALALLELLLLLLLPGLLLRLALALLGLRRRQGLSFLQGLPRVFGSLLLGLRCRLCGFFRPGLGRLALGLRRFALGLRRLALGLRRLALRLRLSPRPFFRLGLRFLTFFESFFLLRLRLLEQLLLLLLLALFFVFPRDFSFSFFLPRLSLRFRFTLELELLLRRGIT